MKLTRRFLCVANDTIGGRPLTLRESYAPESGRDGTTGSNIQEIKKTCTPGQSGDRNESDGDR